MTMDSSSVAGRSGGDEDATSRLAIGLCTYKRPTSLERLLKHIATTSAEAALRPHVVIVDNDGDDPAVKAVVDAFAESSGLAVSYLVERKPGISAARNAVFEEASRLDIRLLAMIDDDEWPSSDWLPSLLATWKAESAVVVGGPVRPVFPEEARSRLERYRRYWSVCRQELNGKPFVYCTCNFLIDLGQVTHIERPLFEEKFGLSGGGDTVFFRRLFFAGLKMAWSKEALVYEEVPPSRASIAWLRQRRFRVGNHAVGWELVGGSKVKSLLKTAGLTARLLIYPLLGRDRGSPFMGWMLEFDKVRGRYNAHSGQVFMEYARPK